MSVAGVGAFTMYTMREAEIVISRGLHRLRHIDTVIGVPRSGQIFAAYIATQLGCSLADVATAGRSIKVAKHGHVVEGDLGRVLLVEDVVNKGIAIQGAIEVMRMTVPGLRREQITTCSIWTNPGTAPGAVDIDLGGPHAERYGFLWQIWHSARWPLWATDFDGVLCEEPPPDTARDEGIYRQWVAGATGKWLPRPRNPKYSIGAIITSRPEGVRGSTEEWLRAHGIAWERLIMVPVQQQHEVNPYLKSMGLSRGRWKAQEAAKIPGLELFIESSEKQSLAISQRFQGLVWCTDTQQRFRDGGICNG